MKSVLLVVTCLLANSLAINITTDVLSSSPCIYLESTDSIDCSGVSSSDEITAAMEDLASSGQSDITEFLLRGNNKLTHLPQGMLGEMRFKQIIINENYQLTSCGDILGSSKSTVLTLDLSYNHLSYLPRMESTSLTTFKQNGGSLTTIASNAFNAMPNLQTIELKGTGVNQFGLFITGGAFEHLPMLQSLDLTDFKAKDNLATKGAFTFNSPHLRTVDLRSQYPLMDSEVGSFGGFNNESTLYVKLNAVINIESFYNVFNSGSKVVVQELQPCMCNLDWIKFSCFLPQATIQCVYLGEYWNIQELPEDNFQRCCFGK